MKSSVKLGSSPAVTGILVLVSLLSLPSYSQSGPQKGEEVPTFRANSRLVVVDVQVVDKEDDVVRDLRREDFEILEDGEKQQLVDFAFEEVSPRPSTGPNWSVLPGYANNDGPRPDEGSTVIVLVDERTMNPVEAAYGRSELNRYFQKGIPKGCRVALFVLGKKLEMVHDFTDNAASLQAALSAHAPLQTGMAVVSGGTRQSTIEDQNGNSRSYGLSPWGPSISGGVYAARIADTPSVNGLRALQLLARSLQAFPGRKTMIWVSTGFPSIFPDSDRSSRFDMNSEAYKVIKEVSAEITNARIAVYPVDPGGLQAVHNFDLDNDSTLRLWASQTPLREVASLTGGEAFINRNFIDGFVAKTVDQSTGNYVLTYRPKTPQWDGKFHRIRVRLRDGSLTIRHRTGYYAVEPVPEGPAKISKHINDAVGSVFLARDIWLQGRLSAATDTVPAQVEIALPAGSFPPMRSFEQPYFLQVFVAGFDGSDIGIKIAPQAIDLRKIKVENGLYRLALPLESTKDLRRVRLVVRDRQTSKLGSLDLYLPFPPVSAK